VSTLVYPPWPFGRWTGRRLRKDWRHDRGFLAERRARGPLDARPRRTPAGGRDRTRRPGPHGAPVHRRRPHGGGHGLPQDHAPLRRSERGGRVRRRRPGRRAGRTLRAASARAGQGRPTRRGRGGLREGRAVRGAGGVRAARGDAGGPAGGVRAGASDPLRLPARGDRHGAGAVPAARARRTGQGAAGPGPVAGRGASRHRRAVDPVAGHPLAGRPVARPAGRLGAAVGARRPGGGEVRGADPDRGGRRGQGGGTPQAVSRSAGRTGRRR
jgi:hypothetical protein